MGSLFGESNYIPSKTLLSALPGLVYCTSNTLTPSSHALRYVLKNRATDEPLFVIVFTLIPKDQLKDEEEDNKKADANDDDDVD